MYEFCIFQKGIIKQYMGKVESDLSEEYFSCSLLLIQLGRKKHEFGFFYLC